MAVLIGLGDSQQLVTARMLLAGRSVRTRKRRVKKTAATKRKTKATKRRKVTARSKPARLQKGTPAARAFMARLRKLRKKK